MSVRHEISSLYTYVSAIKNSDGLRTKNQCKKFIERKLKTTILLMFLPFFKVGMQKSDF